MMNPQDKTEEVSYTREQIKDALRIEMQNSSFMGKNNGRYYTILGIILTALDNYDKHHI